MASLEVKIFHWICAVLTLPFGMTAIFAPSPEKVKFVQDKVALPLPRPILGFCSSFVHLTVVSHELTSGFFLWCLLRDHGFIEAPDPSGTDWMEIYYGVAMVIGLFVAIVFWTAALADPGLMANAEFIFPAEIGLKPEMKRHLLFQAMFGPTDPYPECSWQTAFRWFMRYIHTLCPLLLLVESMLVLHRPAQPQVEFGVCFIFISCYLSWNFFCWWLLRTPPYPLQRRIGDLGIPGAVACYAALVVFGLTLLVYSRRFRFATGDGDSLAMLALPIIYVCWATIGLSPFKVKLAEAQGLNSDLIFRGWAVCGKSPFLSGSINDQKWREKVLAEQSSLDK
eukprot:TRINITY_DN82171_c0_g1_i1.p1 TRINITY_DN82171_c0_g1~~TRINITY_DN82171_c0_g1_i1.p1  ORF type:complete len:393 (-),score=42.16 TRINITY_DN82171_c0_g1_i1:392-1405(-)